jgi:hypothetical protein
MQLPRWSYAVASIIAVAALYVAAAHPAIDDLHRLDRLAHKVERAAVLSPEAAAAINRVVEEARQRSGLSAQAKAERDAAIARVLCAIKAKERVATAGAL